MSLMRIRKDQGNDASDSEDEHETEEYQFALGIVLLLLGAWLTLLAFMVLLNISIGRVIFTSFSRLRNGEKRALPLG
jgi:hypothetical protein